jgi:CBS domain containing-hemolysin-like protein
MTVLLGALALVSMAVAAVVSGFETGIYALSHIRLRYRLSINDARARTVEKILAAPQEFLIGVLVAQNAAVYFTTAVASALLEKTGLAWASGWSTVILAVIFFICVEATPKNVFRRAADVLVYPLAKPFAYGFALLRPAGMILGGITRLARRVAKAPEEISDPFFTRERLAFHLREGQTEGILSTYQVELTQNILRGERVTVARAMVPIEKVAALSRDTTIGAFNALSRASRYARYPVFEGSRENMVGVVNIYDCYLDGDCSLSVAPLVRPAVLFAPDVLVTEAIKRLSESRQPMGVVADKGRALGIVTLKDCIEEIVGELYDW